MLWTKVFGAFREDQEFDHQGHDQVSSCLAPGTLVLFALGRNLSSQRNEPATGRLDSQTGHYLATPFGAMLASGYDCQLRPNASSVAARCLRPLLLMVTTFSTFLVDFWRRVDLGTRRGPLSKIGRRRRKEMSFFAIVFARKLHEAVRSATIKCRANY